MKSYGCLIYILTTILILIFWIVCFKKSQEARDIHNKQLMDDCIRLKNIYLKSLKGVDKEEALKKGREFYKRCKYVEKVEHTEAAIQNDLNVMKINSTN